MLLWSFWQKSFCSWELLKKLACFLRAFNKCQQAFWELRVAPHVSGRIFKRQQGRWISGQWKMRLPLLIFCVSVLWSFSDDSTIPCQPMCIYKRQQARWMPVSGRWGSLSCPPSFSPCPPFFSQPVNELFSPNICRGPNCNGLKCQFSGR